MKSNFKKLISFLISYSLIFNNILYASSIVLLDVNKDTKVYDINEEDTTIIDIARPSDTLKKISLNLFKIFNTEKRKILINNSKVKIKSRLTNKEIEANQNYKNEEDISDIIIFFTPSEPKGSNLSSYFEILGNNKVDFIFSDPNGLISKGGQYINIRKLSLISGSYDDGNYKVLNNSAKISILPLENDSHLGINTGEVDELYLLSREINISGEIILKGLLSIETRVDNGDNKINKPKFSFQTSSFGNIQAGSIKLITLEPDTDVNITTSIITTMDDMIFNLNRNLLLSGNTAKLISESSKLIINATNLTLDNSSTISSYEDMTLTIKNSLLNTNKSLIHTQSGNIVMKLQELKNHNASIIQSGSELIINGKLIENIGLDDQEKNPKDYGEPLYYDLCVYSVSGGGVVERNGDGWFFQKQSAAFIEKHENTGKGTELGTTNITHRSMLYVLLTTSQSKIIAANNITINDNDTLRNIGSLILSRNDILVNSKSLLNERTGFNFPVRFIRERYWRTRRWFHWEYRSRWMDRDSFTKNKYFYSNTPSLIYGRNINLNVNDIANDPRPQEAFYIKDSDKKVPSLIYSKNRIDIKADAITDGGLILSARNNKNIASKKRININTSHISESSKDFKYVLSSVRENILISKIINSKKFREKLSSLYRIKTEELIKLLEKSAETIIKESDKTKKVPKVRVLLYDQDNDVRGYSFSPNQNTRIIGLNIRNHDMNDSTDLIETIFHECYDEEKHTDKEEAAIRFGQYARSLWDAIVRINKFNYIENGLEKMQESDQMRQIIKDTKETLEIYEKIKKQGDKAGVFNEAKIMARVLDNRVAEAICEARPEQRLCVPSDTSRRRLLHYEIFFEDDIGGHLGFHGGSQIRPDEAVNLSGYNQTVMEGLDDRAMREAFETARREGVRDYRLFRHNCQHFAMDDIMPRYERIMTQRMLGLRSDTERLSDEINRNLIQLTSSFMRNRIMTEPNTAIRDQRMTILESLNQYVVNMQQRTMTTIPQHHYFQFQQPNLQPMMNNFNIPTYQPPTQVPRFQIPEIRLDFNQRFGNNFGGGSGGFNSGFGSRFGGF